MKSCGSDETISCSLMCKILNVDKRRKTGMNVSNVNFLCNKWVAWPHEGKLLIYTSWAGEHLHFRIKGLIYLIPETTNFLCSIESYYAFNLSRNVLISEHICTKIRPCERNWFWPHKKRRKKKIFIRREIIKL